MSAQHRRTRAACLGLVFVALSSCSTPDRVAGPDQSLAINSRPVADCSAPGISLLSCPGATQRLKREADDWHPKGGTLDGLHLLFQFQPEGLAFSMPARLTLSYAGCPLIPSLLPKRIVYTTDALELLQLCSLRTICFIARSRPTSITSPATLWHGDG